MNSVAGVRNVNEAALLENGLCPMRGRDARHGGRPECVQGEKVSDGARQPGQKLWASAEMLAQLEKLIP